MFPKFFSKISPIFWVMLFFSRSDFSFLNQFIHFANSHISVNNGVIPSSIISKALFNCCPLKHHRLCIFLFNSFFTKKVTIKWNVNCCFLFWLRSLRKLLFQIKILDIEVLKNNNLNVKKRGNVVHSYSLKLNLKLRNADNIVYNYNSNLENMVADMYKRNTNNKNTEDRCCWH